MTTMQSPEILLPSLNSALLRLYAACSIMTDEDKYKETEKKLLEVMRHLLLSEILGEMRIVVIGGSQGAGKTTLLTSMYHYSHGDDQQWLQGNEGRGEKIPVLILEKDGLKEQKGYIRRLKGDSSNGFEIKDIEVSIIEFQHTIRNPNPEDLLPVLHVPRRYFTHDQAAWLLLPGYEKQDRDNESWQKLMRQAMTAAGGYIVVTDGTRLATDEQRQIANDMLGQELKNCDPYIVITKTENIYENKKEQMELKNTAQSIFKLNTNLVKKNIILTGTSNANYVKEWMPLIKEAILELHFAGRSNRHLQINQLHEIVKKNLLPTLNSINSSARSYFQKNKSTENDKAEFLSDILERFDEAVEELREKHHKEVKKISESSFITANKSMEEELINEHEGFKNYISHILDTHSEVSKNMRSLVEDSWRKATSDFYSNYSEALSLFTSTKLGKIDNNTSQNSIKIPYSIKDTDKSKLIKLGYLDNSEQPVRYTKLNSEKIRDIRILLGNNSKEAKDNHEEFSKKIGSSIDLLPVMILEYIRIGYAMPDFYGLKQNDTVTGTPTDANMVKEGVENLQAGIELGRTAIKSLAAVLAVDVISDGDSDILGALFGSANTLPGAPVMMHPAAIAAIAVVASAYIASKAVMGLRTIEKNAQIQASHMLASVRDHHIKHLQESFDEAMREVRAQIKEKMQQRYRINEFLIYKDRLNKAIADVESIARDLLYELRSSAGGIQPLVIGQSA